jgi:hypothetical protein
MDKILKDMELEGKVIFWLIPAYLVLDFFGAFMWAMSGQTPGDGFFIGAITRFILQLILG